MEFQTREELITYASTIEGLRFKDIDTNDRLANLKNKGKLGQVVEESFFGYDINSNHAADFEHLGIELKVTPYKINKNGSISAKERLVLTIINYMDEVHTTFETSSFFKKCQEMLLVFYRWEADLAMSDYEITKAILFAFTEADLEIIKQDYEIIVGKIRAGLAHEISEADTNYLAACTKGANSSSLRQQPFSDIMAMQRAYSLKASFMTHYLRTVVFESEQLETLADATVLKQKSFTELLNDKFSPFIGLTQQELFDKFQLDSSAKSKRALLISKMLGIKGNKLDNIGEFAKANIKFKTIVLNPSGTPKEAMSFETINFLDLVTQTWETSDLREMFATTKFLFTIFEYKETEKQNPDRELYFKGVKLWNMPLSILDNPVKAMWEQTVETVKTGVEFTPNKRGLGNNLPSSKFNGIAHVRPKSTNAADKTSLPNGDMITKQCFWLNTTYVAEIIK
ncbi:MAG: Sau3AI family type II restriction endonuclease [Culicoidibacterales bacterium]